MKNLFKCVILLSILSASACSKKNRLQVEAENFIGSQIVLPKDSMLQLTTSKDTVSAEYTYIVYVDSIVCSDCAVANISGWADMDLMKLVNLHKLTYAFVFSPQRGSVKRIIERLHDNAFFSQYVYVDTAGIFIKKNPNIPQSKLMHTFLIDNTGKVILVGSPIRNEKLKKLVLKRIG